MATDNIIFLKEWYEELINDEFAPLTAEEFSYILYAATMYSWNGEKTNFEETFGRKDLNRMMAPYYAQIDKIVNYRDKSKVVKEGNQSYDDEAIKALAAQGVTQRKICQTLGYDETKSRSLSSNRGYKEGRKLYLENMELNGRQEVRKTDKNVRNPSEIRQFSQSVPSVLSDQSVSQISQELSEVVSSDKNCQKTDENPTVLFNF